MIQSQGMYEIYTQISANKNTVILRWLKITCIFRTLLTSTSGRPSLNDLNKENLTESGNKAGPGLVGSASLNKSQDRVPPIFVLCQFQGNDVGPETCFLIDLLQGSTLTRQSEDWYRECS